MRKYKLTSCKMLILFILQVKCYNINSTSTSKYSYVYQKRRKKGMGLFCKSISCDCTVIEVCRGRCFPLRNPAPHVYSQPSPPPVNSPGATRQRPTPGAARYHKYTPYTCSHSHIQRQWPWNLFMHSGTSPERAGNGVLTDHDKIAGWISSSSSRRLSVSPNF